MHYWRPGACWEECWRPNVTEVERQTPYSYICFSSSDLSAVTLCLLCSLSGNVHTVAEYCCQFWFRVLNMVIFTYGLVIHNMTAVFYYSDELLWSNSRPAICFLWFCCDVFCFMFLVLYDVRYGIHYSGILWRNGLPRTSFTLISLQTCMTSSFPWNRRQQCFFPLHTVEVNGVQSCFGHHWR